MQNCTNDSNFIEVAKETETKSVGQGQGQLQKNNRLQNYVVEICMC